MITISNALGKNGAKRNCCKSSEVMGAFLNNQYKKRKGAIKEKKMETIKMKNPIIKKEVSYCEGIIASLY